MVAALTDHKQPELIARKVPKFEKWINCKQEERFSKTSPKSAGN